MGNLNTLSQIYPGLSSLDALLIALMHEQHGKPRFRIYSDGRTECSCGPNTGKGYCWLSAYVNLLTNALPALTEKIKRMDSEKKHAERVRQLKVFEGYHAASAYWEKRSADLMARQ